jgi:hypothetical protein
MPPNHTSGYYILLLSSQIRPRLPSGLLPSGPPTKNQYVAFLCPIRVTCPPISLFMILSTVHLVRSTSYLLCSLSHSPLYPQYLPQHPILELPQPTFLPHCDWPSFTPTLNIFQVLTVCFTDHQPQRFAPTLRRHYTFPFLALVEQLTT